MPPPVRRRDRTRYGQEAAALARLRAAVGIDARVPEPLRQRVYREVDALLASIRDLIGTLPPEGDTDDRAA